MRPTSNIKFSASAKVERHFVERIEDWPIGADVGAPPLCSKPTSASPFLVLNVTSGKVQALFTLYEKYGRTGPRIGANQRPGQSWMNHSNEP